MKKTGFIQATAGLCFALVGLAVPLLIAAPAEAASKSVRVPTPSPGAGVGCYRVDRQIYGPYSMTFCLDKRTYKVRGGGLNCEGRLSYRENINRRTGKVTRTINLRRSYCGHGTDWSADRMVCTTRGSNNRRDRPVGRDRPYLDHLLGAWDDDYGRSRSRTDQGRLNKKPNSRITKKNNGKRVMVPTPRVPVPSGSGPMRCTYYPSVRGYGVITFTAVPR